MAAAVAASGIAFWYLALPSLPTTVPSRAGLALPVRGAIHIHTRRSDGTGTVDDVAGAAARAGLQFIIVTDHGDGSRGPDAPAYRQGVLCIDAVEISTNGGHIVAIGMPQSAFPLGGEAADVVEDVRRLGGMAIAAHPDSRRRDLAWSDWNGPFDGIEWLSGDSEWRNESWPSLARALLTYPFRSVATLGALLDRPGDLLNRWDRLVQQRRIVAVAASDAHARIGPGSDPYGRTISAPVPSYEQVFRTFSVSLPGVQLTRDARTDSQVVLNAIREGRVYSSIDALATPALVEFTADVGGSHGQTMGGEVPLGEKVVQLIVEAGIPTGATIRLFGAGESVAVGSGPTLSHTVRAPGAYRVEIELSRAPGVPPVPWIVSNPIYVGVKSAERHEPKEVPVSKSIDVYRDGTATSWRIEKNGRSEAGLTVVPTVGGTQLLLRYGLGGTLSESPYAAAVVPSGNLADFDRLTFTARAARPMRISVQLRASSPADRRWGKSVYLDEEARTLTVPFTAMLPMGTETGQPVLDDLRDLLFVVDTVNTKPGTSGQLWIDDVKFER